MHTKKRKSSVIEKDTNQNDLDSNINDKICKDTNQDDDKHDLEGSEGKMSKYKARKLEKEKLLSQIPKVDENGISFTKIQMRNMMKRVKKGLPPLL